MASRRFSCDGKQQHRSLLAANVALERFVGITRDCYLEVYLCRRYCNYHIGHPSSR